MNECVVTYLGHRTSEAPEFKIGDAAADPGRQRSGFHPLGSGPDDHRRAYDR